MLFYDILLPAFYVASVVTFILFAYDKHCAVFGKWRVPEFVLLLASLFLGAFGGLCGMIMFNHKTSKKSFTLSVSLLLVFQTLAAAILLMR